MMASREIGGYLEMEHSHGQMLHEGAIALNSGQSCLRYIIEAKHIEKIWLPDYMCGIIGWACAEMGVQIRTYRVGPDLLPVWDFEVTDDQWLFVADYYGQLTDACVNEAKARSRGRLVVDETQGYFVAPRDGVDTMYSCRKFFGVPDGGFLYSSVRLGREVDIDVSYERMLHLLGRYERSAGEFLATYRENGEALARSGLRLMSSLTENLLRSIDYEWVRKRREVNWQIVHSALGERNSLCLRETPGPFAYPLLVEDGPSARKRLSARSVYVPTLWPEVAEEAPVSSEARRYARDILPLPIDQRYGPDDIEYMLECLSEEGVR